MQPPVHPLVQPHVQPPDQPVTQTPMQTAATYPAYTPIYRSTPYSMGLQEESTLERLVTLLSDKQNKLPEMEPEIFSGDLLTFPTWLASFETLIEGNTKSPQDRLHYLGKYTAGEAKNCIRGYFTLNSVDTYDRAKHALITRYGDKYRLGEAFKKQLNEWPAIKPGDGIGLRKLSDFLQHCEAAMQTIVTLQCLNTAEENGKILKKLPRYITDRWSRTVDQWLYGTDGDMGNFEGQYPTLLRLCQIPQ